MPTDGETDAHEEAFLGVVRDYAKAPVIIFYLLRMKTEERFCYYDNKLFNTLKTGDADLRF